MKKVIGIMFVCAVCMACGGQSTVNPSLTTTDNGSYDQADSKGCTQHSQCYAQGHKFCVKGTCVGDPQPDVTLSEIEADAVENDASETTTDSTIGPWGEIVYVEVTPEIKPDSGVVDNGTDNGVIDSSTEDVSGSVICKMHSDCNDGNACTIDECQPESKFANVKGCVFSWDEGCCLNNYDCSEGKCVDNACENECVTDADCPSDECSDGSCLSGLCYWEPTNECVACTEDTGCDDGDACTHEKCGSYACKYEPVKCLAGCDPAVGCLPLPECTEDSDCQEGYECLCSATACTDGRCINVTAPPECEKDLDCPLLQHCMYGDCDVNLSKFECIVACPDNAKYAMIWFADTSEKKLGDEVFEATSSQLCTWGWDNKPTFKFNCNNGASFWGYGDQAVVTCNADFTIKKVGNQGVMVVQFDKQCQ